MRALPPPPARIYVVKTLRHLEKLELGALSWWCVERSARPGELGVVYVIRKGITLLFRVEGVAEVQQRYCRGYGLGTGKIEILAKTIPPIPAAKLREHPVLKRLPALGRSFQRKSFRLDEPYLGALTNLMDWSPE